MPVSNEIKRIYASAPTDLRYVETISLHHSQFSQDWYLNNDDRDWAFDIEDETNHTFLSTPFQLKLPTNNTEGGQELNIVFANFGRAILDELEAAAQVPSEPIQAVYRIYTNVENSPPQNDPPLTMSIHGISVDDSFVTATAGRFDILNKRFPRILYNTDHFPGLKR